MLAGDKRLYASIVSRIKKVKAGQQEDKMFLGGTNAPPDEPEFKDTERMRELLGVLEEEQMLKDMLKASSSGLKILWANKFSSIQDCSMIQATYRLNG